MLEDMTVDESIGMSRFLPDRMGEKQCSCLCVTHTECIIQAPGNCSKVVKTIQTVFMIVDWQSEEDY